MPRRVGKERVGGPGVRQLEGLAMETLAEPRELLEENLRRRLQSERQDQPRDAPDAL